MSGDIVDFPGCTETDIAPEKVCDAAAKACEHVLIIGETMDGEFYIASSSADRGWHALMLIRAMHELAKIDDERVMS